MILCKKNPFVVTTYAQKVYSSHWFKKKKIEYFHFFPKINMAAKHAKIDRVDSLDSSFQQVPLVQNF